MNTMLKIKTAVVLSALALTFTTAGAHRRPRPVRKPCTHVVVPRRVAKPVVSNTPGSRERLAMVQARIQKKGYITAKQYAKMTRLPLAAAQSELDAFAFRRGADIKAVDKNGRRIYVRG